MHFRALIIPAILSFAAACSPATEPAEEPTAETPAVNDEMANLITEGRAIAEENCTSCHAIGATGASPRTEAPELRTVFREFDPEAISADFREGKCIRLNGSMRDIDARVRAEKIANEQNERFNLIVESTSVGL